MEIATLPELTLLFERSEASPPLAHISAIARNNFRRALLVRGFKRAKAGDAAITPVPVTASKAVGPVRTPLRSQRRN
jgi:hypothetical protein